MEKEKKIKKVFTAWGMDELEEEFDLKRTIENKNLEKLLNDNIDISDFENQIIKYYQKLL